MIELSISDVIHYFSSYSDITLEIHCTSNTCHSYLTSPSPQHHHIVQAIPISPSSPTPTSALPCIVFDWLLGFFQQSWVCGWICGRSCKKISLASSTSSLLILQCDPWHSWCAHSSLGVLSFLPPTMTDRNIGHLLGLTSLVQILS